MFRFTPFSYSWNSELAEPHQQDDLVIQALDQFEIPLLRYAMRLLAGDEDLARDAVQHAFMKLCERDVEEIQNRIGPWLFTVCRNKAMDFLRRAQRHQEHTENDCIPAREPGPESELDHKTLLRHVKRIINELPLAEKEAAELWAQDFSNAEIAEVIGQSVATVRVRLHRALSRLRINPCIQNWLQDSVGRKTESPKSTEIQSSGLS